jgi:dUTP pyrophosphatase
MSDVRVAIERLAHGADLPLPTYATPGSAGLDLLAAVHEPVILAPLARVLIPTGIRLALPAGYEAQVRPRSGLALRHGLSILNAPGTVPYTVGRGARIAQLVLAPIVRAAWVDGPINQAETARRDGGFGSTGEGLPPMASAGVGREGGVG